MRRRPAGGEGSSWWRGGRTSWWINVGGDDSKLGLSVVRCDGGRGGGRPTPRCRWCSKGGGGTGDGRWGDWGAVGAARGRWAMSVVEAEEVEAARWR
jgi:hypothetical protein